MFFHLRSCPPLPSISSHSPADIAARCRGCHGVASPPRDANRPRIQRRLHVGVGLHDGRFQRRPVFVDDHAWLDSLDEAHARIFAAEQGYDLVDDHGMLTDWWGYCWMILAEKRGLLTPENRAAARAQIEEKYRSAPNVIGVIVGR